MQLAPLWRTFSQPRAKQVRAWISAGQYSPNLYAAARLDAVGPCLIWHRVQHQGSPPSKTFLRDTSIPSNSSHYATAQQAISFCAPINRFSNVLLWPGSSSVPGPPCQPQHLPSFRSPRSGVVRVTEPGGVSSRAVTQKYHAQAAASLYAAALVAYLAGIAPPSIIQSRFIHFCVAKQHRYTVRVHCSVVLA